VKERHVRRVLRLQKLYLAMAAQWHERIRQSWQPQEDAQQQGHNLPCDDETQQRAIHCTTWNGWKKAPRLPPSKSPCGNSVAVRVVLGRENEHNKAARGHGPRAAQHQQNSHQLAPPAPQKLRSSGIRRPGRSKDYVGPDTEGGTSARSR
jgi:hypothetical protein